MGIPRRPVRLQRKLCTLTQILDNCFVEFCGAFSLRRFIVAFNNAVKTKCKVMLNPQTINALLSN